MFANPSPYRFRWEEPYIDALCEPDDGKLEERIRVAEEILLARLVKLTDCPEHERELRLLAAAMSKLAGLKISP